MEGCKTSRAKKIPVVIKDYSEMQALEIALIETYKRRFKSYRRAFAYKFLIEEHKVTQEEIAKKEKQAFYC